MYKGWVEGGAHCCSAGPHSPPPLQEAKAAKVPFLKKSVAVMEATMWWVGGWPAKHWQSTLDLLCVAVGCVVPQ